MRVICVLLLAVAAPPVLARDTQQAPSATLDGPAVSCIPLSQIDQSIVRNDRVIDFRMRSGRTYRNTLPLDCPGLGFEQRFRYATSLNSLCSTDIITVFSLTPVMDRGSCGLGQFQPVRLAPR